MVKSEVWDGNDIEGDGGGISREGWNGHDRLPTAIEGEGCGIEGAGLA